MEGGRNDKFIVETGEKTFGARSVECLSNILNAWVKPIMVKKPDLVIYFNNSPYKGKKSQRSLSTRDLNGFKSYLNIQFHVPIKSKHPYNL